MQFANHKCARIVFNALALSVVGMSAFGRPGGGEPHAHPGRLAGGWSTPTSPEDSHNIKDSGVRQSFNYASFLRPNVGLTEEQMGMYYSKFREIDRRIEAAVTVRLSTEVANQIKLTKYSDKFPTGSIGPVAPDVPPGTLDWATYSQTPNGKLCDAEWKNVKNTPFSLNADLAGYVLNITDGVLKDSGITPNKNLRAKAFLEGVYHFMHDIPGKCCNYTFGQHTNRFVADKGVYSLNVARAICVEGSATYAHIANSKATELGFKVDVYCAKESTEKQYHNYPVATYSVGTSKSNTPVVEAYDTSRKMRVDSRTAKDDIVAWIALTGESLAVLPPYSSGKEVSGSKDPINGMPKASFDQISKEEAIAIEAAARGRR